jgi:hypothetical protein
VNLRISSDWIDDESNPLAQFMANFVPLITSIRWLILYQVDMSAFLQKEYAGTMLASARILHTRFGLF